MTATTDSPDDARKEGAFLRGWGGLIAVLLGIALAGLLTPIIRELIEVMHQAIVALGASSDGATLVIYWLGMIAVGAGFVIAFLGPDERIDLLRAGGGGWSDVATEALVAASVAGLWFGAGQTWLLYGDEFNAYDNATELAAVGTMVAIIAGAVLGRWLRHRHTMHAHGAH